MCNVENHRGMKVLLRLKPKSKYLPINHISESPNLNVCESFPVQLPIPKILQHLPLDWKVLSENLGIEVDDNSLQELDFCLNKFFYSDQSGFFEKSFGMKTRNLYDLGFSSINQISDTDLVVDKYGFAFSYFDMRKLDKSSPHPYVNHSSLQETPVHKDLPKLIQNNINLVEHSEKLDQMITVTEYFESIMCSNLRSDSSFSVTSHTELLSFTETNNPDVLETVFEVVINHDFFTNSLISIYRSKVEHLDYTVALLYYILAIVDDFGERYRDLLITNYSVANEKYPEFLRNYIQFLREVQSNYNIEKFHYVCIIVFKILQYRYQQLEDSLILFDLLKTSVPRERHSELYWSIVLDRMNYLHGKMTNKISLINISVDNIFSNAEFNQYYYTLMVYLHTKYMELPLREVQTDNSTGNSNGSRRADLLEHYKPVDNYSYLDLLQYFTELAEKITRANGNDINGDQTEFEVKFRTMIHRYYLSDSYITINRNGLVVD